MIRQLTVFVPNKPGMLARVSSLLAQAGIQVIGFMCMDASDFSIVRLVVDNVEEAISILSDADYSAQVTRVLALKVRDLPGGLFQVMNKLAGADLNVDYCYSASVKGQVVDIIQVSGDPVEVKLAQAGMKGLCEQELAALGA